METLPKGNNMISKLTHYTAACVLIFSPMILSAQAESDDYEAIMALTQTINACNACHSATGSAFINVSMDDNNLISLRHPHILTERKISGGHSHSDSKQPKQMMENMEEMMKSEGENTGQNSE